MIHISTVHLLQYISWGPVFLEVIDVIIFHGTSSSFQTQLFVSDYQRGKRPSHL